jgi:hypothetical protein
MYRSRPLTVDGKGDFFLESDLYAHLRYRVRKQLDVSVAEYFYLDMVHQLSHNRWCTKSVQSAAEDIGITARGLQKMRSRLIELGWLRRNVKGHLKTTDAYFALVVENSAGGVNKVRRGVNKVPVGGEQSSYKNNNRKTENSGMTAKELLDRRYNPKKTVLPAFAIEPVRIGQSTRQPRATALSAPLPPQ